MANQQELILKVANLANVFQKADSYEQMKIAAEYLAVLETLHLNGWKEALARDYELPDKLMPQDYLQRRKMIFTSLEQKLGDIAMMYRESSNQKDEALLINNYHKIYHQLYSYGHWHGLPDSDSELPDDLMPLLYHQCKKKIIEEYKDGKCN